MRESQAVVAMVFFDKLSGHTHIVVDVEDHIRDGGDESSAYDWVYEKFGKNRALEGAQFGSDSHVKRWLSTAHRNSVEVRADYV